MSAATWAYYNNKAQEAEKSLTDTVKRFEQAVQERDTGMARRMSAKLLGQTATWADATEEAKEWAEGGEGDGHSDYRA